MTAQERKERLEQANNPAIEKYGFKVIPNVGGRTVEL